jgi:hypothetical protein
MRLLILKARPGVTTILWGILSTLGSTLLSRDDRELGTREHGGLPEEERGNPYK